MWLVVWIHLIGTVVSIGLIYPVIRIMQICPMVQLLFCTHFPWNFSHVCLLSEPKKSTHFASYVDCHYSKTTLHVTKQSQWKEFLLFVFGSILWCKASKQQGDNDSQPANCFLNSIVRIWLKSIVSKIYSFVCLIVYITAVQCDSYSHNTNHRSSG